MQLEVNFVYVFERGMDVEYFESSLTPHDVVMPVCLIVQGPSHAQDPLIRELLAMYVATLTAIYFSLDQINSGSTLDHYRFFISGSNLIIPVK